MGVAPGAHNLIQERSGGEARQKEAPNIFSDQGIVGCQHLDGGKIPSVDLAQNDFVGLVGNAPRNPPGLIRGILSVVRQERQGVFPRDPRVIVIESQVANDQREFVLRHLVYDAMVCLRIGFIKTRFIHFAAKKSQER